MSDAEADQDKSEPATPYKLERARRKGSVARGSDLGFASGLLASLAYFWINGPDMGARLAAASQVALVAAPGVAPDPAALLGVVGVTFAPLVRPMLGLFITIVGVVLAFELVQTGLVFTAQPLKPDFSRLSPGKGFKRVFSARLLRETVKNVLKLAVYVTIAWLSVSRDLWAVASGVGDASGLVRALAGSALRLTASFMLAGCFFAAVDQILVRREYARNMRMSRRELRRESRDREGDPRMKQRRKALHAEFVKASQSLRNIRGADVLITNPVHFAVGLRYDPARDISPIVVARGSNAFALRLKKLAFVYGVTVVEDRALARGLFRASDLNAPIPESFYGAVAELYNARRQGAPEQEV